MASLLSKKEMQIAILIADDLTTKEIAKILENSPRTITNHISNMIKKLNVNSRVGIAIKTLIIENNGLRSPSDESLKTETEETEMQGT